MTLWLLSGDDNNKNNNLIRTDSSDYAMSNFTMTIMDKSGLPSKVIRGERMAHYPENDSTEIISPVGRFIDSNQIVWLISSQKGLTQGKGEDIYLSGNVIITQENDNSTELRTEAVNIDTVHHSAYTDLAVKVKSLSGETNSIGLYGTFEDKMINLHSKVKGKYDAPATE